MFNSAEYLTASKTVACKQHCSFFFFTIQINPVKFKITADTVVCHFSLFYRWLEEETRVIRNYIRHVINDLKRGFLHERGICLVYRIPKDKYTSDGEKAEKTKNW